MKKRIIFVFITSICIISMLLLPCSAAVGDIEKAVIIDRVYGSATSDYAEYYLFDQLTLKQGESGNITTSFAAVPEVTNYFFDQFHFYLSDGLPIASGGSSWKFLLSNYYNRITHEETGSHYLTRVNQIRVYFTYADGQQSGIIYDTGTNYYYDQVSGMSNLSFNIKPTRNVDVIRITVQVRSDISCYGLSPLTSSDNLYDYYFDLEYVNVSLARTEVFPSADGAPIEDYANEEKELIDATSGGLQEITSLSNNLTQAFLPSSSIYRGAMFFGNFMSDIVGTIPDLNMIILVSLAIGIIMVVLGSVLFSVGSGRGNKVKGNKGFKGG